MGNADIEPAISAVRGEEHTKPAYAASDEQCFAQFGSCGQDLETLLVYPGVLPANPTFSEWSRGDSNP